MDEREQHLVFISSSPAANRPWVSEFVSTLRDTQVLKDAQFTTFFDPSELTPGEEDNPQKILAALRYSHTLVTILSAHSLASPSFFFELGVALEGKKKIIPVVIDGINLDSDLKSLPFKLGRLQRVKESSPIEAGKRVAEMLNRQTQR